MKNPPTFVLVGHCGPDNALLRNAVRRAVPDANVAQVEVEDSLQDQIRTGVILLINRVLEGAFEIESGIDLIGRIASSEASPVMMLISNLPDAQKQGEAAGTVPGFGKSELHSDATMQKLRDAVAHAAPAAD